MVLVAACLMTGVITWRIWPSPRAAYSLLVFGVLFVASAEYALYAVLLGLLAGTTVALGDKLRH